MAASVRTAKLETTYEYSCGGRVAAEFDARVNIGLEDGVLLVGEVELYGYDDNHQGAYEICNDNNIAEKVRSFILNSYVETTRAFEILSRSSPNRNTSPKDKPNSLFEDFIGAYKQCHFVQKSP